MRIRHRPLAAPFTLALALAAPLAACGSLEGDTDTSPTLATLKGNIIDSASAPPSSGAVRVAVVWRGLLSGQYDVAEDLPISAITFPASFQIDLDVPPPASAMMSGQEVIQIFEPELLEGPPTDCMVGVPCVTPAPAPPPSLDFQVAGGVVVAYLDKNGNGKLDLVPTGADSYVDEIIGTNDDLWLVYFQGTLPDAETLDASGTPALGYNLYRHADCTGEVTVQSNGTLDASLPIATGEAGIGPSDASFPVEAGAAPPSDADAGTECKTNVFLPITTLYTLSVTGKPQGSSLMCQVPQNTIHTDTIEPAGAVPPGGYPTAATPGLSCQPIDDGPSDGSYTLTTCARSTDGLCQQEVCLVNQYPQPSPVPDGWPCGTFGGNPLPVGKGSK